MSVPESEVGLLSPVTFRPVIDNEDEGELVPEVDRVNDECGDEVMEGEGEDVGAFKVMDEEVARAEGVDNEDDEVTPELDISA